MTTFEIFLIIFAAIAIVWGAIVGLIRQLGSIAGIVLGILACRLFGQDAAYWLASMAESGSSRALLTVLAYVVVFLVAYLCAWAVARLVKVAAKKMQLGVLDRLCGAVFKLFLFMFCLSLAMNLWAAIAPDLSPTGKWAHRVEKVAPRILGSVTAKSLFGG